MTLIRDLYQAIARAAKISGDESLRVAPKLFDLMNYYESIGDTEGVDHCVSWLQRIAWKNPEAADDLRAKISKGIVEQLKTRPKRIGRWASASMNRLRQAVSSSSG